jgi:sugar lactone lactonase YvrE
MRGLVLALALLLNLLPAAALADRVTLVTDSKLDMPFGVDKDAAGNLYVIEYGGNRLRKIDPGGVISTVAGTGKKGPGGDGGPAAQAEFSSPHALALDRDGNVYVADTNNYRVRRIDARSGDISTFAGTGDKGFSGDGGPAKDAQFGGIYCVAFDPNFERLICTDLDNKRIRCIDMKTGVVTTVAGSGEKGVPPDGAEAAKSPLVDPRAAVMDAQGSLYVLERSGHALRVVDPGGKIRTVAGTGKKGAEGDGGPARQATLNGPKHLCVDESGDVIIADTENHVIRKYVARDGTIVRVAGCGKRGSGGVGGPPRQVELNKPHGVFLDRHGALYISDSENGRVLKLQP